MDLFDCLPNEDDAAFFREHGWWLSPSILDAETLENLDIGIRRYQSGERDWLFPIDLGGGEESATGVLQADYLSLQLEEFRKVIENKTMARIAARLAPTNSVRLFHDQLVIKAPLSAFLDSRVGWHTDKAYWRACTSNKMITAWVSAGDVRRENGPLSVWDGSHQWPFVDELHTFDLQDHLSIEQQFRNRGLCPRIVDLEMKRGQVSFHHCRLVHGSRANQSDRPRFGYAIHYQDEGNTHLRTAGMQARHINDLICRKTPDGDPDYSDPEVFPALWP